MADDLQQQAPRNEQFLSWAVGIWQVEDDVYEITLLPGGALAGWMRNGAEISAAWVISHGRKVPNEHSADVT